MGGPDEQEVKGSRRLGHENSGRSTLNRLFETGEFQEGPESRDSDYQGGGGEKKGATKGKKEGKRRLILAEFFPDSVSNPRRRTEYRKWNRTQKKRRVLLRKAFQMAPGIISRSQCLRSRRTARRRTAKRER